MKLRLAQYGDLYIADGTGGWRAASDVVGVEENHHFEAALYRFCWTWYFGRDGASPLLWDGLDLGPLLTLSAFVRCADGLRSLWMARRLVAGAAGALELEVEPGARRLARALLSADPGRLGGLRLRLERAVRKRQPPRAAFRLAGLLRHAKERLTTAVVQAGAGHFIRSLAARATARGPRLSPQELLSGSSGKSVLIVADVFNLPSIEILAECALAAARMGVQPLFLCLDPRVGAVLSPFGRVVYPHLVEKGRAGKTIPARRLMAKLRDRVRSTELVFDGLDVRPMLQGRLLRTAQNDLATASSMLDAVWPILESTAAGALVVSTDSHVGARTAVLASALAEVPSLTFQHGVVGGEYAYVPVLADFAAVWGPWCRDWYVQRGTPPTRLAVTGNPRFDRLTGPGRRTGQRRAQIVVAPSSLGAERVVHLLGMCFDAARRCGGHEIVVRLHPGERYQEFVQTVIEDVGTGVPHRIDRGGSLWELLLESRALVTTQSGVGVDAILADCPLIVVSMPGLPQVIPYVGMGAAVVANSVADLVAYFRLAGTGMLQSSLEDGRRSFLASYVGPVDGDAARRALEAVRSARSGGRAGWLERVSRWRHVFDESESSVSGGPRASGRTRVSQAP